MSENTNYNSRVYDDPAYRIAKGMYLAIGGDPNVTFDSTDAIYEAINGIYAESGGRINIQPLDWWIYVNGTQEMVVPEGVTGYNPVTVTVEVPQKYTDEYVADLEKTSYNEGYQYGWKDGHNEGYSVGESAGYEYGYAKGLDVGTEEQKALLESITITENGTYNKEDGWNAVTVEVPTSGGGSGGDGLDFESIGWDAAYSKEINDIYKAHLAYSASQIDKVNNGSFQGDTNLVFAPYAPYEGAVVSLSNEFKNCKKLQYVPLYDTSNVRVMDYMFYGCTSLQKVPLFDTGNVQYISNMFDGCTSLQKVPLFDTSNVTKMNNMFYGCTSLLTIPQFDTSSATNMSYMFNSCSALTTVPQLDASKVTNINAVFSGCTNLTDVGGFLNLGMASGLTTPSSKYSGIFYQCKSITRESVINIFNGLYDRATAGYSNLTIFLDAAVINRLTEDDIAIATNKGWTISQ